jgi:hypothetical protein
MSKQLEGLLDSSLYAYADHPEHITVKRLDLELCLWATISSVICEGGNIASVACNCMCALDALEAPQAGVVPQLLNLKFSESKLLSPSRPTYPGAPPEPGVVPHSRSLTLTSRDRIIRVKTSYALRMDTMHSLLFK